MNETRQLEIATAIIKWHMRKNTSLKTLNRSSLEETAREIGVPADEFIEFVQPILQDILDEATSKNKKK